MDIQIIYIMYVTRVSLYITVIIIFIIVILVVIELAYYVVFHVKRP